ncbi:hypothetical protein Clacol_004823 [Clathrus columnatus]|uniref:Uncharacterized protein n=1 Tax=Clathrus columnatus TaxID=1419009 RepID=A0AAV5ADM1_9AGAM|nr:hypothetical protein Clacol_004823 [Clathrus columnatus]
MVTNYPDRYQSLGSSATHSGLRILPILITLIIAAGISGGIVTKTGNYWWFLFLSPLVTCIAAGLLFTIDSSTTTARIIGYQILWGIGVGCIFQNVLVAIQAEFEDDEELVPQASSLVPFINQPYSMAGSIFANRLHSNLKTYAPGLSDEAESAVIKSVTAIMDLPASFRPGVIQAYAKSLAPVFLSALPAGVLASLSAFALLTTVFSKD